MKTLLKINNISIDYDLEDYTLPVINNVSLEVKENEFVCILGPSGCGKSTLLKAIAGFIKPIKGNILLNDQEIIGPDRSRGVVFQEPNLLPWYNVKQNVSLGPKLANKTQKEIESIVDKYLGQVELLDYKKEKVFELSGGQKQRVAIARTLANNPEVILMDEPFGALDSFTRKKMQTMIRNLWKKNNSTIFFVTHDIDEALLLGTKIYVMRSGKKSIVKAYDINYTSVLLKNPKEKVVEEDSFIKIKEEILDLLEE
ncbi:ABC transporter ATP-binding protein [Candidatus Izemoplasma sp. B36]|uniref:ABC transporter ATP-binding protein n=1 Tax=Candidatus Izemoplasma sp. B36 TaxID=3242468 RepID=UPI003558B000